MCWHLHCWSKSNGAETAGTTAQIKAVALATDCIVPHIQQSKQGSLQPRGITFIKFSCLRAHLFNILCDKMGNVHEALLLQTQEQWFVPREHCKLNTIYVRQ